MSEKREGDSEVERAAGSEKLLGTTLGDYEIRELIRPTRKSWVYHAYDPMFDRDVAVKVLKPGQGEKREEQFERERKRLGKIEKHPNIATPYSGGRQGDYYYFAMELVKGRDLQEMIDFGETFSLERILNIAYSVTEAVDHSHKCGVEHKDIKPKNIKEIEEKKGIFVLDYGSTLTRDKSLDDVFAIGSVIQTLLEHREKPQKKVPKGLEKIVERAMSSDDRTRYKTAADFRRAINRYGYLSTKVKPLRVGPTISRRRLLQGGIAAGILAPTGGAYYVIDNHVNSIDSVAEEIGETSADDFARITPLFRELVLRFFNRKLPWLATRKNLRNYEKGVERLLSPYDISKGGTEWSTLDGTYWSDGFWPGILWKAYEAIKDDKFRKWAMDWAKEIPFSERDELTINPIRFYYSHALGYDITQDENLRKTALEAADLLARRFNPNGNYLQNFREIDNSSERQQIQIDTMTAAIPLLCWAYQQTNNNNIENIILNHCDSTIQYNINEDGSTVQIMKFDPKTMTRLGGIKSGGYSADSCLSRGQARAISGFIIAYKTTGNDRCLETAERCARYFIDNLPPDRVSFYDFKDPNLGIPKDSSSAAIAASGLLDLFDITSNPEYRLSAYQILRSLTTKYLAQQETAYLARRTNYQGLLLHGCSNKNRSGNIDISLIYGDYYFIESLTKI